LKNSLKVKPLRNSQTWKINPQRRIRFTSNHIYKTL
jgi:hypothetical protein